MKKIRKILRKGLEKMEDVVIKISRGRFDRLISDNIIFFSFFEILLFFVLLSSEIMLFLFYEVLFIVSEMVIVKLTLLDQKRRRKKEQEKKERLLMLMEKYQEYVLIVETIVNKKFYGIDPNFVSKYEFELRKNDYSYIEKFEENLEFSEEFLEVEDLDSFSIASCLMFALIEKRQITFLPDKNIPQDLLKINYIIAFEVALKIISESFFYKIDEKICGSIEEELEKRKTYITKGVIPSSYLNSRILDGIIIDNIYRKNFCIINFSNLLHLIYIIKQKEE